MAICAGLYASCLPDRARPARLMSARDTRGPRDDKSFFPELALDQGRQRRHRLQGLAARAGKLDLAADAGSQHHQAHDGEAGDLLALEADAHLGVELAGGAHELGGGTGVQAALVGDGKHAPQPPDAGIRAFRRGVRHEASLARMREATVMYLRPVSWAMRTASAIGRLRTEASLTSIGRLTPASTSMGACSMIEMARLEGVPPNMSVSTITPSPVSQALALSRISARRFSMSSSAPMHTADTHCCGPTTCSSAAMNSRARLPWVTSTMPIIRLSYPAPPASPAASASRCERVTERPAPRNHSASSSATATDRCRPPVQPTATVK